MPDVEVQDTAKKVADDLYGVKLNPVPKPEQNIGVDTQGVFYDNIIQAAKGSQLDIGAIESLSNVSQNRNTVYDLLDTMAEDSDISSILEIYAEDCTERNAYGKIVWAESGDAEVNTYINYLLDTLNVDKHIYEWMSSFIRYGDCYLRLYRNSSFDDALFNKGKEDEESDDKKSLQENVNINAYSKNDKFAHYIEMVPNPAEMFELTKFGKTYGYIKSPLQTAAMKQNNLLTIDSMKYVFNKKDVEVYEATEYVHAALKDNTSRYKETVSIFLDPDGTGDPLTYDVNRGQSLLYSSFKAWRNLMLLENSLLLNRLSKSAIVRVINVEVGDMPKEAVGPHMTGIKNLIEQKTAFAQNQSMAEYTNPGPIENNIYVPTHGGVGLLTASEIGGEVNPGSLSDIEHFQEKLFGSLKVPKQFLGRTQDSTGFNGGTALSLISSRYAKTVGRLQNAMLQALTDAINILLIDKNFNNYVNKFELHMVKPTTQEEKDRHDNKVSEISVVRDLMDLLADVEDPAIRLQIIKLMLANTIENSDVIELLENEIEKLEDNGTSAEGGESDDLGGFGPPSSTMDDVDLFGGAEGGGEIPEVGEETIGDIADEGGEESGGELPTPADLGIGDLSNADLEI